MENKSVVLGFIDKKALIISLAAVLVATGTTNLLKNEFISIIILIIGSYLMIISLK